MGIVEILLIAIGLSMDAFAVAVCKGLSTRKLRFKHYLLVGAWFGGFQGLMPALGFLLGSTFEKYITAFDHWVAFGALALIGANMIKESFKRGECSIDADFSFRTMLAMAVATSIDALAVGVSLAFLKVNIWFAVFLIGLITAVFSATGIVVGNMFGCCFKSKAELAGGVILVVMGCKILLEHTLL